MSSSAIADESTACRIVVVNELGERCYVEKIFSGSDGHPRGMPLVGGTDADFAGIFHRQCAERAVQTMRTYWLTSGERVEIEAVP